MREIKFRAWDKDSSRLIPWEKMNNLKWYIDSTKNFVLMQYTGLKDKNGKEIYEGDILFNKNKDIVSNGVLIRGKQSYFQVIWHEGKTSNKDGYGDYTEIVGFALRLIPGHFARKNDIQVTPMPELAGTTNIDPIIQEEEFYPMTPWTDNMEVIGNVYENPNLLTN